VIVRFLGHPLHPMLVHFPIAFWALATTSDAIALVSALETGPFAWRLHALGTAAALPAMIAGFVDFASLDQDAEADGQYHLILMGLAWVIYLGALLTRFDGLTPRAETGGLSFALSIAGFLAMAIGAWFGGRLVYHHGAGSRLRVGRS
jgi:uncharacterized membrane protein